MEQERQIIGVDPTKAVSFEDTLPERLEDQAKAAQAEADQVTAWYKKCLGNMADRHEEWKNNLRDYKGIRENPEDYPLNSSLYLRLSYAHVLTVVARLYGFPLKTEVIPIDSDSESAVQSSVAMSSLIEHMLEKAGIKKIAKNVYMALGIFGSAFIYTDWDFREEELTYRDVEKMKVPKTDKQLKVIRTKRAKVITKDQPLLKFVSPFDFFIEPGAASVEDAKYVIERCWVSPDYLTQKKRQVVDVDDEGKPVYRGIYINVDKAIESAKNENQLTTLQEIYGETRGSDKIMLLRCWTADRRVIEVAGDNVLVRNEPNPNYNGRKPYVEFTCGELPEQVYGEGEVAPVKAVHEAVNDTVNLMIDNGNLSVNTVFKRRFGSNCTDTVMKLYPGRIIDVTEDDDLTQFTIQDTRQQTQMQLATLQNFGRMVTGNPVLANGPVGYGQMDSSGGKNELLQMSDGRISLIEVGLEISWGKVIEQVGSLIQQYMSENQVIRIVGKGTKDSPALLVVSPEEIIGHRFDYKPIVTSLTWFGEEIRRQQFINFMNIGAKLQDIGPDGRPYPVARVRELFLKGLQLFRMPVAESFVHSPDDFPAPQPAPQPGPQQGAMPPDSAIPGMANPTGTPYQNGGDGIVSPDQLPTGVNAGDLMRQVSATGKEA